MHKRVPLRQRTAVSALILLAHLVITAFVPMADAAVEASARELPLHIEAQTEAGCPAGHDHLHCQLCRIDGSGLAAGCTIALVAHTTGRRVAGSGAGQDAPGTVSVGPLGARAPPA